MMRRVLALGLSALLVGAGTVDAAALASSSPPPLAGAPAAVSASLGSKPTTAVNPQVPDECGINITVVLDASGSIGGNNQNVRNAARAFLDALKDTGSSGRVVDFASAARETAPMTLITSASMTVGGVHDSAMHRYYEFGNSGGSGNAGQHRSYSRGDPTQERSYGRQSGGSPQYTNWQEALEQSSGDGTQLVVFITDGDPTAVTSNGRSNGGMPEPFAGSGVRLLGTRSEFNDYALYKAINAANAVKGGGSGPRVLAVGVGEALQNSGSQQRLKDISGPDVYTGRGDFVLNRDDVALVRDFGELAQALRRVATELCSPSVTITKLAQSASSAQYAAAPGWNMTVEPTVPTGSYTWTQPDRGDGPGPKTVPTNTNGQAQFQWEPPGRITSTAAISETAKSGWTFDRAECRRLDEGLPSNDPPFVDGAASFGQPDFSIPVGPDAIVSCKYYNAFDYRPRITVTKAAVDDPVRGNAAGWNETYVFTVTNTGNTPLSNVRTIDPQCQTISGPSGDGNGDGRLDVTETWIYQCRAFIQRPTTDQPLSRTNTVTVTGTDPPGTVVTDTATVPVDIKTPAVMIEKSARSAGGAVIEDGDTVPAGSRVTYEYRVTNPGNDTLQSVTVTDDRCAPLTRISGSGQLLAPGAVWVYSCSQALTPPSTESTVTNTATVTANWSNWTPTGQNNTPVTARAQKTIGVKKAATITVVKAVAPNAGSQPFAFTVAGTGVTPPDASFTLNPGDAAAPTPSRTVVVEPTGGSSTYVVTESAVAGWQLTDLQCVDDAGTDVGTTAIATGRAEVTLAVGDAVTCVYTNERLPRLSVVKVTSPSEAEDEFGFSVTRPAPLPPVSPGSFTLRSGASQTYQTLPIGPVTIAEAALPAGWSLDQISCGAHPVTVNGTSASLDLGYGDNAVCMFVNAELAPATLTVAKKGTAVAASPDFAFTAAGTGLEAAGVRASTAFDLAIGDTQQLTVRPEAAGSTYSLTEALPAPAPGESGWTRTSIQCVLDSAPDSPVSGDLATGAVDVSLAPGQHATCTFVNEQLPRLTIRKAVSVADGQSGADQTFDFTGAGPGMSPATLGDGQSRAYASLTPGAAVSIAEVAVTGWTLTGLACSGPGAQRLTADRAAGEVSGALTVGDDVTCTFANTKEPSQPATLTVIKQVDPGGSAPEFDFTLTGPRVPAPDQSFSLSPAQGGTDSRVITVTPDDAGSSYTLTESALPSGWDFSSLSCQVAGAQAGTVSGSSVTLDLVPGDAAACTYLNRPQAALTIAKKVSVAEGQTGGDTVFDFTTTGLGGATAQLGDGESRRFTSIPAGTALSVTETALDGWSTAVSCTGTGAQRYAVSGGQVSGTAQPGDAVTCTYVNTKDPAQGATLTVVKKVNPAGAGPSFPFDLAASNPDPAAGSFALLPGAAGTAAQTFTLSPFEAGGTTYTISEAEPTGWELTSLACTVNGGAAGTPDLGAGRVELPLNPGDAATCTFINEPQAQFTVAKQVSVGTGQAGADETFAFAQTGLSDFGPLGHNDSAAFTELATGTAVSVEETTVAGWSTQVACTGSGSDRVSIDGSSAQVEVRAGDDITCTYVNTKDPLVPAVLAVGKLADPAAGAPDFDFTVAGTGLTQVGQPDQIQFPLSHDDVAVLTVHPVEAGNDYTVTEAGLAGWNRAFIGCSVSSDPNTEISGDRSSGAVTVPGLLPGEVAVCLYGNQEPGSLTVAKHTNTASQTQFNFAADQGPTAFTLGDGDVQTFAGLEPGTTVEIAESVPSGPQAVPQRWTLVDITCVGAAAAPAIDLAAGRVAIEVGAGEDVTCTYSDARVPPATITVTKSASPAAGESFGFTASGDDGGVVPGDQSFDLAPNGGPASRTFEVYPGPAGETYTISEVLTGSQPFEWRLESIACQSGGSDIGTATGAAVELLLQPGDSVSCTFVNRQAGRLTVAKSAPENPDLVFPFSWSLDTEPFELTDGSLVGVFPITAGSYWVAENVTDPAFPVDWHLAGGSPVCTGTAADPDYSRPNGANLIIGDGESAWCTFTNRFDYRPDIQLVKTVNRSQVLLGGEATYTYELTNTGNVDVVPEDGNVDSIVTDDKCTPVVRTSGSGTTLAPGQTWVYQCTSAGIATDVTNIAKARVVDPKKPGIPLTSKDTQTVTVLRPGMTLSKIADATAVYAGTEVTYTYEVANVGEVPIRPDAPREIWVADDQCAPVAYGSGDTNNDGILDTSEVWTYTCTAPLTTTTRNVGTVTGTPFVPPSIPTGPEQIGPPIPVSVERTVEVVTPGIAIVKSVDSPNGIDPGRFAPGVDWAVPSGETVTYTYEVTSGAATTPMQVVSIDDDVCAPLIYRAGDTNGDGLLDLDETWTYTCDQLFVGAVTVRNTVVVTAREPKVGGSLTDTDTKTVQSYIADITVVKAASEPTIAAGDRVTYTYQVSNPGPEPLRAIDVTDDRCAPLEYQSGDTDGDGIMFPDEIWVYTCSQVLQANAINIATATGRTPGTTIPKNTTSTHVEVITKQDTGITVEKSAAPTTVAKGGQVTYTYRVTATKVPLAEVKERIADDTCAPVTYVSGDDDGNNLLTTKAYGEFEDETWIFTCTTTVDRTTTNTVTATGVPKVGNRIVGPPVTATDTATVEVPGATAPGTATPDTGASVAGLAVLGLLLVGGGVLLLRLRRA